MGGAGVELYSRRFNGRHTVVLLVVTFQRRICRRPSRVTNRDRYEHSPNIFGV